MLSPARIRLGLMLRVSVSMFCMLVLAGCATRMAVDEAAGERARLEFRVLDSRMPAPMLYWVESPWHIETALILSPPFEGCSRVRIFANRSPEAPALLSERPSPVPPLQLGSLTDELAAWDRIGDRRCALLVTAGRIAADDFTGVSVSVPDGIVRRHAVVLQEDLAGKGRWWGMVPVGMLFDVTHVPLYYAVGLIGSGAAEPAEPVTVIFKFPDGSRKATSLRTTEVRQLLQPIFPDTLAEPPFALKRVRPWARAALVKLRLEFIEAAGGDYQSTDEWLPKSLELSMVDGHGGKWVYRLDTDAEPYSDLTRATGDASAIIFELVSESGR